MITRQLMDAIASLKDEHSELKISAIAAVSADGIIGCDNNLPWKIGSDLLHFKSITVNHAIIMGRKTFDSLPKRLPDRLNVVLSSSYDLSIPQRDPLLVYTDSIESACILALEYSSEIFIVGGAEIYSEFLPLLDKLYITRVHTSIRPRTVPIDGFTYFPIDYYAENWKQTSETYHAKTETDDHDITFMEFERV